MTTRRPLLTAVAAGTVLCALWFVPTANATPERPQEQQGAAVAATAPAAQELAASGSVDTTPYLFGGIAFVAAGGALVTGAVRRSRTAAR
ncbi:hypothetical protein [Streptomyces sp. UNOB3_S3]|uniref:hypothetical protein n=1 Tax=Streptomyces sp. UNOB3_S3 TaxID=2871682 RepID=UPI001E5A1067|nr:hypothetical protein [Streptomyces sp. UNOB3_S3]MCC3779549.1 hypothetical protein [Streptomyces sp. UNOB3_S3]